MEPNPYKSPVIPPSNSREPLADSGDTLKVLVDMRNMQREMLTLIQDAHARQKRTTKVMLSTMAGVVLFGVIVIALLFVGTFIRLGPPPGF